MSSRWRQVCALEEIYPDTGVCALLEGRQIAVFRVRGGVFAIGNRDPASGANVLSRASSAMWRRVGGCFAPLQTALQPSERPLPRGT